MKRILYFLALVLACFCYAPTATAAEPLRIATFHVDATPPLGSPTAYGTAQRIVDRLSARGIVLIVGDKPIVLCAVDWIGIGNGGQDVWREQLAQAAGTTIERVAIHALHQHDAPRCDFSAERLLDDRGLAGKLMDVRFVRDTIRRTAEAVRKSIKNSKRVTHVGIGKGKVEKVASNRRILGPDGKVKIVRWSRSTNPDAIAAPEGVIDPYVQLLSFWDGDQPLASITYYATHPQSYYGKGGVSCDFVGLARGLREKEVAGVEHIHFNGAGGNIAAGKYNDGSPEMRPILAKRLAAGMKAAWKTTLKRPITRADVEWRTTAVNLPVPKRYNEKSLLATLNNPRAKISERIDAARQLSWFRRAAAGREITIGCLRLGDAYVLHMPGELFVEYQLAAQKMRPKSAVLMAAYGEYGPGYIGTEIAYRQGGYETNIQKARVAPSVERVLMAAMKKLLK